MMLYFMPAFLTLLFLNFASGFESVLRREQHLQHPQQYLIARRRLRDKGRRPRDWD